MSGIDDLMMEITPQVLLKAYACGIFPMSESADDPGLFWVEPENRGIIPLDNFHVPKRLGVLCVNKFTMLKSTAISRKPLECVRKIHLTVLKPGLTTE